MVMHLTFVVAICIGICVGVSAQDIVVYSPGDEGTTSTPYPFTIEEAGLASMRYQQVFNRSDFSLMDGRGGYITQIYLFYGAGRHIDKVITNIQLRFSTTQKTADGLSQVFDENVGADDTLVYGGLPLALKTDSPESFFVAAIALQQPFFYSSGDGNLLLDVRNFTGAAKDPFAIPEFGIYPGTLDAERTFGDSVSSVYSFSVDAPSGSFNTAGLVMGFRISAVPEPSTGKLVAGAIVMLSILGVRRQFYFIGRTEK